MPFQSVSTSTRRLDDRAAAQYRRRNLIAKTMRIANSGVEIALRDVVGKALGQPIHALLGGLINDFRPLGSGESASFELRTA